MTDVEEVVFQRWLATGKSSECETCGDTPDAMDYTEYADGSFELYVAWGCYGGASEYGDPERAIEIVQDYSEFKESERDEIVNRLRGLEAQDD